LQLSREERLEALRGELVGRFQQICRNMSSDDFAELVDEMARFRLKYEDLEAELARHPVAGAEAPGFPPT
jgi:hypothetical protein